MRTRKIIAAADCAHLRTTGAVGKQTQLLFLDAVLHIATRAIQLLIHIVNAADVLLWQIGHYKSGIVAFDQQLGFGNHLSGARPGLERTVAKLHETARCQTGFPEAPS